MLFKATGYVVGVEFLVRFLVHLVQAIQAVEVIARRVAGRVGEGGTGGKDEQGKHEFFHCFLSARDGGEAGR